MVKKCNQRNQLNCIKNSCNLSDFPVWYFTEWFKDGTKNDESNGAISEYVYGV